jgi:hypothetical protein
MGRYAAFLRLYASSHGNSHIYLKSYYVSSGSVQSLVYESQSQLIDANGLRVLDCGIITIPYQDGVYSFDINIYGNSDDGTNSIYFYDLVLMPVDEWAAKYSALRETTLAAMSASDRFIFDSITQPKKYHDAIFANYEGYIRASAAAHSAGQASIQPNVDQRLWFFTYGGSESTLISNIDIYEAATVHLGRMSRYIAMRGDR